MKHAGLRKVDLVCHRAVHTSLFGYLVSLWYSEEEGLLGKTRPAIKSIMATLYMPLLNYCIAESQYQRLKFESLRNF